MFVVLRCPQFSSASASRLFIGIFSSRGPSGSMRPGSWPQRPPFARSSSRARARPVHCRAMAFAAMWPAWSRGPVVGLENRPASQVLHTNSFFWNHRGRRVRFSPGSGVEPRPAVRCGVVSFAGWRSNLARRCGPRLLFVVWGIGARALGIASPSLAMYANGGNASRSSVRCGYSAPQPPKNSKRNWAAGQAK